MPVHCDVVLVHLRLTALSSWYTFILHTIYYSIFSCYIYTYIHSVYITTPLQSRRIVHPLVNIHNDKKE